MVSWAKESTPALAARPEEAWKPVVTWPGGWVGAGVRVVRGQVVQATGGRANLQPGARPPSS